jgi:transcriptional regulator with XRE-family HTH domain
MGDIEGTSQASLRSTAYRALVTAPNETRTPNVGLLALREETGLSQQDLADELNGLAGRKYGKHPNITKKTVGRWERGEVEWPQPFYRRLLADYFKCAVDELGFRRPRQLNPTPAACSSDELLTLVAVLGTLDPRVEQDQQRWREAREMLGGYRRTLATVAARLYPEFVVPGLENTGIIAHPSWLPSEPVPLRSVVLDLDEHPTAPAVTGSEHESGLVRPLASAEKRYQRYSHAVRDLASPRLFENRLCFRVVGVDWAMPVVQLQFGAMCFFDSIDTNEALAHEMALHHLSRDNRGDVAVGRASWRRLAFRKLVGDPFDLSRRPLMGAIGTLTIRGGESPSMVLHQRDGSRVAGGGGMVHLLPAGIFQPSSVLPGAISADFSIWRNIQREYSEELLGCAEHDGSGRPIDYARLEPFVTMDQALADGRVRVYCLGLTLDALTLCADLLTVAVFEPELYDHLFCDSVNSNDEGVIPVRAVPFEGHTIARLREVEQLSPGAAAAIHLAWIHRNVILARQ